MTRDKLTLGQRVFMWGWNLMGRVQLGSSNPFGEEIVRTFGLREFLKGAGMMGETMKLLDARWGPMHAQLIMGFAGVWSGCRWCGVGHLYAANLEQFKREGELLPIDEREIPGFQEKTDDEVLAIMQERFSGARWEQVAKVLRQQYMLRSGKVQEETRDDQLLQMANHIWEWLNECTITAMDIDPHAIPPQTPLGKDRKLMERYREARQQRS
jgi:hypothetical protein